MKENIIGAFNGYDLILIAMLAVVLGFALRDFLSMFFDPKRPKERGKEDDLLPAGTRIECVVAGMMCGVCESRIASAVRSVVPDAKGLCVSHVTGKAVFVLRGQRTYGTLRAELSEAIGSTGYEFLGMTVKRRKSGTFFKK